jgi:hypothetical protein
MRFAFLAAGVAAAVTATAAPAVTINLNKNFTAAAGSPSFYIIENDFVLPVGFSNAVLTITELNLDDRGVALLNGNIVDNAGIFGPGNGNLVLTQGGPNNPFTYTRGNGARNVTINSGFNVGANTFRLVLNDTNNGIFGDLLPNGVNISGGNIVASITFDVGPRVPEPATWAMMIAGFGLAGTAMRGRRAVKLA